MNKDIEEFESYIKSLPNTPPNLHEVKCCATCKHSINKDYGYDMSCGLYDYGYGLPYDICDSWEEDK